MHSQRLSAWCCQPRRDDHAITRKQVNDYMLQRKREGLGNRVTNLNVLGLNFRLRPVSYRLLEGFEGLSNPAAGLLSRVLPA